MRHAAIIIQKLTLVGFILALAAMSIAVILCVHMSTRSLLAIQYYQTPIDRFDPFDRRGSLACRLACKCFFSCFCPLGLFTHLRTQRLTRPFRELPKIRLITYLICYCCSRAAIALLLLLLPGTSVFLQLESQLPARVC